MDRKEVYICMGILLATTVIGLAIVALFNNLYTQLLFVVLMALAFVVVVKRHRRDNIYYCMKCHQKVKIGFIPDIVSMTLDNGDKILKCKKCKIKVNFRSIKKEEEGKSS